MGIAIYIVDDEPRAVQYFKKLLAETGVDYSVVGTASNGVKAVQEVLRIKPDIAEEIGISEGHLRKVFKQETDIKIIDFLTDYRLENAVEHEKMKRKMQIDNLMLRINPHFIYNTLNSIIYMASESEDNRIIRFTNAFISLLQNTLRIRNTIYVSLEEEQENYGGMRKIGVANVNKRMKEIYGESHRLEIVSEEGAGTRIVMRIPYRKYEE